MMHRLYAKRSWEKRYRPMDYNAGTLAGNLIHATLFNPEETEQLRSELPALHEQNPAWIFQLRKVDNS